jgi:hypothetical protein
MGVVYYKLTLELKIDASTKGGDQEAKRLEL